MACTPVGVAHVLRLRRRRKAQDTSRRGSSLTFVQGEVRVKRSGDANWRTAQPGLELAINDKVRTQRNAFATIEFQRGGQLRMQPESLVAVTDLRLEVRTRSNRSTFTLEAGQVEAELDALEQKESEFRIRTPSAEASVMRREVSFQ